MKVCTFLGDPFRIYDEVTQRIEEALEEILAAHGEMELGGLVNFRGPARRPPCGSRGGIQTGLSP